MSGFKLPDNWDMMPVVKVLMSGVPRKVRYDEENGCVYLLDDKGEWTGKKAIAPDKIKEAVENAKAKEGAEENKAEPDADSPAEEKSEAKKAPKQKRSKINLILVAIIVVLAFLLFTKNNAGQTASQTYSVIVAMENIQPGESIKDKVASIEITAEEYRQFAAGGIYDPSEYSTIENYVATTYIPKDGCITYGNIAQTFNATNPWLLSTESHKIIVPYSCNAEKLPYIMWGTTISLTIKATKTISNGDYPDANRNDAPGADCSSTLKTQQIDKFVIKDLTICDLQNSERKSLYSTFAAMAAIPEIYRENCISAKYENSKTVKKDIPAYLVLEVTPELESWYNSLYYMNDYTFVYEITITGEKLETPLQKETNAVLRATAKLICKVWRSSELGS